MPTRLLIALCLAAGLSACAEKPQTLSVSAGRAEARDQTARLDAQRQRTLEQSGADRIHNEGMLR